MLFSGKQTRWRPRASALGRLFSSLVHPTEYGFVRDTLGEDGHPLDAMVLVVEPTFTGCVILSRPVGLFKMVDEMRLDGDST